MRAVCVSKMYIRCQNVNCHPDIKCHALYHTIHTATRSPKQNTLDAIRPALSVLAIRPVLSVLAILTPADEDVDFTTPPPVDVGSSVASHVPLLVIILPAASVTGTGSVVITVARTFTFAVVTSRCVVCTHKDCGIWVRIQLISLLSDLSHRLLS